MKQFIFVILILASSQILYSQDTDKGDKKSKEILDKVIAKTESYKTFKAEFIYKMINTEAGVDESTEGILFVKGDKYRLFIAGQLVICNGETIWTYIEDAEEVQINSVEDSDETITPSNLLTSYNKDYKSKFVRETFQYGTTVYVIDLTPVEGKSYYKIRLIIDKKREQILEITIFDKNESTYSYIINKFTPNIPVDDSEFTFNPADYPDVDVVDMR
ncbi:MAG: outer membrane lipoprotein carrier protein LolA [Bacteroidetes bacterium]|nr:outer membrane lipoprotein carrier protein LolA [Bacteroidota bacterium]MBL7105715.1 outer membrane lipoprotein carrier protein LolA [Bacteroidales bacterium]